MLLFPFDVNSLRVHLKRRCSWLSTIRMRKLPRTCSQTLYCLFRHHFVVIVSASFRHCFVIISSSFCRCFGIISSLFCHYCVRTIACYHLDQDIGQWWRQHKRSRHQWLQVTYASCSLIIIATTTTATTTVITTTVTTIIITTITTITTTTAAAATSPPQRPLQSGAAWCLAYRAHPRKKRQDRHRIRYATCNVPMVVIISTKPSRSWRGVIRE